MKVHACRSQHKYALQQIGSLISQISFKGVSRSTNMINFTNLAEHWAATDLTHGQICDLCVDTIHC
jgi:hypothetical protein